MRLLVLNLSLFFLSTNLFSWHYNCHSKQASLLFDDRSIAGKPFLIFSYKNIHQILTGDEIIQTRTHNKNIFISFTYTHEKYLKIWAELPQDDLKNYVDFAGKIFLEDNSGRTQIIRVQCLGQKVIR